MYLERYKGTKRQGKRNKEKDTEKLRQKQSYKRTHRDIIIHNKEIKKQTQKKEGRKNERYL